MSQYKIFVDLDGVLADFVKGVNRIMPIVHNTVIEHDEDEYDRNSEYRSLMWRTLWLYQNKHHGEMWYELDLMEDALDLWNYILPHDPQILSATGPTRYGAADQKFRWVAENLNPHTVVNLTHKAAEKANHAAPNHILIDDKDRAIGPWVEAGGIGILHTSAENTIRQLKDLGI
jgi:hypothetical protein